MEAYQGGRKGRGGGRRGGEGAGKVGGNLFIRLMKATKVKDGKALERRQNEMLC
jgi:hypothetical protein